MVCAIAEANAKEVQTQFQWPVKWPMVCANRGPTRRVISPLVSMACEVADGLRRGM